MRCRCSAAIPAKSCREASAEPGHRAGGTDALIGRGQRPRRHQAGYPCVFRQAQPAEPPGERLRLGCDRGRALAATHEAGAEFEQRCERGAAGVVAAEEPGPGLLCPPRGVLRPPGEQGGFGANLHRIGVSVAEPLRRGLLGGVGQLAVGIGEQPGRHQGPGPFHGHRREASRGQQLKVLPGGGECAQGRWQVTGDDVHAAEIDPAERRIQGEPVPFRDLPAAVQVGAGEPDVPGFHVHEAAVIEHLDEIERARLLREQRHGFVVLP